MTELWRPVEGSDGRYEVSSLGRVRSNGWTLITSHGRTRRIPARVLSGKPNHSGGYAQVNLRMPEGVQHVHVHHLVLTAFVGPRPEGAYGCHNNGDPTDNRVENLRWDTPSGNRIDRVLHGTDHNVNKTHCGACGEPYDSSNTAYWGPANRWRRCINCRNRYQRTTYNRRKANQPTRKESS